MSDALGHADTWPTIAQTHPTRALMDHPPLAAARSLLATARRPVVLTGAGISAESGVPTFRGEEGLWRRHDPMALATPEAFVRDPRGVWAWYQWRRSRVAGCQPNAAHVALAAWEARIGALPLITQNVDGLHQRAGSREVLTLHGDLFATRCTACSWSTWEGAGWPLESGVEPEHAALDPEAVRCPECGELARPGVVWFGEALPSRAWEQAHAAAESADLMLVVGTSAVVYPAAALVPLAKRSGARVVVVDPGTTEHCTVADVHLQGPAARLVPELVQAP